MMFKERYRKNYENFLSQKMISEINDEIEKVNRQIEDCQRKLDHVELMLAKIRDSWTKLKTLKNSN